MSGVIAILTGVGTMCVAGFGIVTALNWFHSYELDMTPKPKERMRGVGMDSPHREKLEALNKKVGGQ